MSENNERSFLENEHSHGDLGDSLDGLDKLDSLDDLDALDDLNEIDGLSDEDDLNENDGLTKGNDEEENACPRTVEEMIRSLTSIDELYEFAKTLPPLTEEELAELEDYDDSELWDDDELEDDEEALLDDEEALLDDEEALLEDEEALLADEEELPEDEDVAPESREEHETISINPSAKMDIYEQLDSVYRQLMAKAHEARAASYCPYSGVAVGAALLTATGKIYLGANIENASFSPTICAERVAFFKAISAGERNFVAIAVVGAKQGEEPSAEFPPCGVCRQVMSEFCDDDFVILLGTREDYSIVPFADILPHRFTKDNF